MVRRASDNNLVPMKNPFAHFVFPKPNQGGISTNDFDLRKHLSRVETMRYPDQSDTTTALNASLNKNREPAVQNLIDMLTVPGIGYDKFNAFGWSGSTRGPSGSLEDIHGNYHFFIGGPKGHMAEVLFSSFDPIFWFHHCNIDRLFAIWQSIYPSSWLSDDSAVLLPFRAQATEATSDFWTSRSAKTTEKFGYKYTDAQGQPRDVQKAFATRYSWAVRNLQTDVLGKPPANMVPQKDKLDAAQAFRPQSLISSISKTVASIPNTLLASKVSAPCTNGNGAVTNGGVNNHAAAPVAQASSQQKQIALQRTLRRMDSGTAVGASPIRDESTMERQWYILTAWSRGILALNGTFTIYYFIGGIPDSNVAPAQYCLHPTLAGVKHIFAAPVEACDNCGQHRDAAQKDSGTLPINPILLDHKIGGHLADLCADNILQFFGP
ncbi:hypothetical protein LQW54_002933 [Pestalotiopsis sp. IQ-011]